MICLKYTQCVDYLSDPINGETKCCFCCITIKPMTIIKVMAFQDCLISIGFILIGINAIVKLNIFDLFLNTLTSDSFMYGIIFTAAGGLQLISMILFYFGNRKRKLKWYGLYYILLRSLIFIAILVYSILLLLCLIDKDNLDDPIYGFNPKTKKDIVDLSGGSYGIIGGLIAYGFINQFFSFILFLCYKFVSNEYEYERKINMQQVEEKQTFAPEWFRNQEVNKKNQKIDEEMKMKNKNNIPLDNNKIKQQPVDTESNSKSLQDMQKNNQTEKQLGSNQKKSKFKKNAVVPQSQAQTNNNLDSQEDLKAKSTKLNLQDDNNDLRPTKQTLQLIDLDQQSQTSFNPNNNNQQQF